MHLWTASLFKTHICSILGYPEHSHEQHELSWVLTYTTRCRPHMDLDLLKITDYLWSFPVFGVALILCPVDCYLYLGRFSFISMALSVCFWLVSLTNSWYNVLLASVISCFFLYNITIFPLIQKGVKLESYLDKIRYHWELDI